MPLILKKRTPCKKNGNSWGVGGPHMTLWKGNSKGVKTKEPSMGGMDIFWNHTLQTSCAHLVPLRLLKRQSPTTVLLRTTLIQTITQYELLILLGSNHLLNRDELNI